MEAVGCCVVRDNFQAFKHRWPRLLFCSWVPFLPTCANHAIKRFRVAVCDEGVLHTFFKGCKRMRARARARVYAYVCMFFTVANCRPCVKSTFSPGLECQRRPRVRRCGGTTWPRTSRCFRKRVEASTSVWRLNPVDRSHYSNFLLRCGRF